MRKRWVVGFILWGVLLAGTTLAQESQAPLTLEESIKIALDRNLGLQITTAGVAGSEFRQKSALTQFFPTWTGQYGYIRYNDPITISAGRFPDEANGTYAFSTTVNQPLFAGGSISANYRSESLGVDISKYNVETVRRNVVLQVRQGYFNILAAQKALEVAAQAVKQFEAQLEVSKAYFDVGLVAKNDVLQAEVRLANAKQSQVNAENALALAKSSFNNLLRREINAPLNIIDILSYQPSGYTLENSIEEALQRRPEIKTAELTVEQTKQAVTIARSGYYPWVSLAGNYSKLADDSDLNGHWNERYTVLAQATLAFSDWWRLGYKVGESKVRVTQAQEAKYQIVDNIILEV